MKEVSRKVIQMTEVKRAQALEKIRQSQHLVFMTGAGVSVPSGIPDYRSLDGIYHGVDQPEYLLSHRCLMNEPQKFYQFVKNLYHPDARPNIIHKKMAELETKQEVTVISQNIDGLHQAAESQQVINFHGSLYHCYCLKCGQTVSVSEYMTSDQHHCGGQIRPDVVLYEEALNQEALSLSVNALEKADVIVVVGTSLKVYPFSGLIQYRSPHSELIVVNREEVSLLDDYLMVTELAESFFEEL